MRDVRVDVPEGSSGLWEVRRVSVTQAQADRANINIRERRRRMEAGDYTQLVRHNDYNSINIVMSDTPSELRDHFYFEWVARGHVLINGLGLGMCIEMVVGKVDFITVIEKSPNVIKLVKPHYQAKYPGKIEVINADAFAYKPPKGAYYDAAWHDIWDSITASNLPEMHRLHRKYGKRAGWQGSWAREDCEYLRKHGWY